MDIKKLSKKLIRAKEIILKGETPLTDLEKQLMESFSFDLLEIKNKKESVYHIPSPQNDNSTLTAEQHFRLRLIEKTGTGSTAIH